MKFSGNSPIFIQLAEHYKKLIRIGAYEPGSQLPSVREIALLEGINPNTVARAMKILLDEGYLVSIEKKGYFVSDKKGETKDLNALKGEIGNLLLEGYSLDEIESAVKELKKGGEHD
ncbi:MAG: GntR family transcriptional regulator [Bacilli bacterium]|nr:GntR family transcriptional regulator [Bacilli bacterium]